MRGISVPPEWRWPLLGIAAVLVAANRLLPIWLMGIILCVIGVMQALEVWQRIKRQHRASTVTYWRGVRYETPQSSQRPTWRDIQPQLLWVVLCITTLTTGIIMLLRVVGW